MNATLTPAHQLDAVTRNERSEAAGAAGLPNLSPTHRRTSKIIHLTVLKPMHNRLLEGGLRLSKILKEHALCLLPRPVGQLALERGPATLKIPKTRDPESCLLDAQHACPHDEFLALAHHKLQVAGFGLGLRRRQAALHQGHQAHHSLGVEGSHAVDDTSCAKGNNGAELIAEATVHAELVVVDSRVEGDLHVVGDIAMGPAIAQGQSTLQAITTPRAITYILHPTILGCAASALYVSGKTCTPLLTPG